MSRQATAYLAHHLTEIRRATYTDKSQKTGTRALGEDGLALLLYLCDTANAKDGHRFFMTAESMREDTGIATLRTVRRLLAGFTELGFITPTGETVSYMGRGKPTPVYVLTLVPGVSVNAQNERIGVRTGAPEDISTETKANNANTLRENNYSEPEPEPEPDPQAGHGAGAWGIEHDQLLAECLACEDTKGDNGRLVPWLKKQYRPLVIQAIKERPSPDLVGWCVDTRRGIEHRTKEEPPEPCQTCGGYIFRSGGDPLDGKHAVWTGKEYLPCPLCEPSMTSPTSHESDLADLTYNPVPQLTAKEERDNIKAMIAEAQRRFRAS
jgi:hypothetical protein